MAKVLSTKKMAGHQGGHGAMQARNSVGTRTPGMTGKGDSGGGKKFIVGGKGKMAGFTGAGKVKSGVTK